MFRITLGTIFRYQFWWLALCIWKSRGSSPQSSSTSQFLPPLPVGMYRCILLLLRNVSDSFSYPSELTIPLLVVCGSQELKQTLPFLKSDKIKWCVRILPLQQHLFRFSSFLWACVCVCACCFHFSLSLTVEFFLTSSSLPKPVNMFLCFFQFFIIFRVEW